MSKYELDIKPQVRKIFKKLSKKDKHQLERVRDKIEEILEDPYRFKPLKKPLQNKRRVHISSYVLTYEINEESKVVIILRYKHHDEAYKV